MADRADAAEEEDVSFEVSLMNGNSATIICRPADKLQSLRRQISEALEGVGSRSPLCYFRSTQETPELLAGHTPASEVAGSEVRVVVQAGPTWCSEKCFRRAASFNELPGYLDDQWEEERLRFFGSGVFELHRHFHSNHCGMPEEDCLERENYLVATGEWQLDGDEDVLLIGMQKICGRQRGQTVTKSFRRRCWKRDLLYSPSWIVTSIGTDGEVVPEYYRSSVECIDRNVMREQVDW
ncbi:ATG26 [Symbiodinium natans]|uniref:ATG26 protein n=1 Tax=Symbiodinium natans TaxID=878477 RepID=A0A812LSR0_9DINO|nr:ATG26 [Symbiodinium natans]